MSKPFFLLPGTPSAVSVPECRALVAKGLAPGGVGSLSYAREGVSSKRRTDTRKGWAHTQFSGDKLVE